MRKTKTKTKQPTHFVGVLLGIEQHKHLIKVSHEQSIRQSRHIGLSRLIRETMDKVYPQK